MTDERDLGIALSGGGHRATVFGLGALLALADSGVSRRVCSVSSVSGGSIANGIAMTGPDFGTATAGEFEGHIAPALKAIADRGVLLGGVRPGASLFGKLGGLMFRSAPATRGFLRGLLLSLIAAIVGAVVVLVCLVGRWWVPMVVAIVITMLAGATAWRLARRRSVVTEAAVDRELLGGTRVTLGAIRSRNLSVHHVVCTTELQSGVSMFFTNRCVYGYPYGGSVAANEIPLATAVQASACVPGAFAPRVMPLAQLGLTGTTDVVLDDGGVYDNMADEWEYGYPSRSRTWIPLAAVQPKRAGRLVVVNASGGWNDNKPIGRGGLAQELAGLLRAKDVQYDVSTAHRRRALFSLFTASPDHVELDGLFVQITDSPYRLPSLFASSPGKEPDAIAARADEALAFLAAESRTKEEWSLVSKQTSGVGTTLEALGTEMTALLLEHGYTLTMVNLYVLDGVGALLPVDRDRLRRLCA